LQQITEPSVNFAEGFVFILNECTISLKDKPLTMRKTLLLCCLLACTIVIGTSFALKPSESKFLHKRGFEFIPSGTTTINGEQVSIQAFYMLEAEVTNLAYREFLYDLKKSGNQAAYEIAKIDTTGWLLPNASLEAMAANYHSHIAYSNYPVVNISQEGARLYCKWLEEKFAEQGYNVKVRLPELAEWQYAAKGGNENNIYAWEGAFVRNSKGAYLANFQSESASADGGAFTTLVKSYYPNNYGLYNMSGNVSEWLSTDAMSKGGNWSSKSEFIKIEAPQEYGNSAAASPFIGFRPVITAVQ
jgi:formylglycine-generating enzyme required for sulfatase activity